MNISTRQSHPDELQLREQGQRLTPQRRAILDIMRHSHGHITAEDVLAEAEKNGVDVGIASVYRILAWLTDQQLICVTDMGGKDLTYEYLASGRHHHLVCLECGKEQSVPYELMDPVIAALRERYEFEPRIDHQAIFGVCGTCRSGTGVEA